MFPIVYVLQVTLILLILQPTVLKIIKGIISESSEVKSNVNYFVAKICHCLILNLVF